MNRWTITIDGDAFNVIQNPRTLSVKVEAVNKNILTDDFAKYLSETIELTPSLRKASCGKRVLADDLDFALQQIADNLNGTLKQVSVKFPPPPNVEDGDLF